MSAPMKKPAQLAGCKVLVYIAMLIRYRCGDIPMARRWLSRLIYGFAGITFFIAIYGGLLLHFYTTYLSFMLSGFAAGVLTFVFPVFSEIYWFIKCWSLAGGHWTEYAVWVLSVPVCIVLWPSFGYIASKLEPEKVTCASPIQ
jgi:hypothetical protein